MDRGHELKAYLMSDLNNNKYKNMSLVELYASDTKYYMTLERRHLIDEAAISFFKEKGNVIRAAGSIPTVAFRRLKYEQIIDEYLASKEAVEKSMADVQIDYKSSAGESGDSKSKTLKRDRTEKTASVPRDKDPNPPDKQEKKQMPIETVFREKPLHCVADGIVLNKIDVKMASATKTGKSLSFPRYMCPTCNRLYTNLQGYKDLYPIILGGKRYTNVSPEKDEERYIKHLQAPHVAIPGTKCYVYGASKPGICRVCGNRTFSITSIIIPSQKKKKPTYHARFCEKCKTYYLSYNVFKAHSTDWKIINEGAIQEITEELRIKSEEKARLKAERRAKRKEKALKKKMKQIELQQEEERKRQERLEKERIASEERERKLQEQSLRQSQNTTSESDYDKASDKILDHDNNIGVKDFVVRRTTFKCRHHDHKLQNIEAVINIITKDGDVMKTTVPAGYCPNCNIFFIMESTYQQLKMRGTPVCRVSDEKAYLSNNSFANGMVLARESILMQYGYTVSQEEGLTSARRRKILAILIDNKILTKSDIISYLDFFINQRKYQYRFGKAIEKWENDREFVSEYNSGSYTQYGVGGIYRKY